MTKLLLPAVLGLLLGLLLHWSCLSRPWRSAVLTILSGVTALGWTLLGVAVLTWLAVLPPDSLPLPPGNRMADSGLSA